MKNKSENLFSRFVFDASKISKNRVHFRAFQPPKDLKLSVQNIDELERSQIEEIGQEIAKNREQNLKGWGQIKGKAFLDEKLLITIDNKPNLGHTTITGWSEDTEKRENTMKYLAAMSEPVLL